MHSYFGSEESSVSGKGVERLRVSTGTVVIIDQFMLANEQFLSALSACSAADGDGADLAVNEPLLRQSVENYGGAVVKLPVGTVYVCRDPQARIMLLFPVQDAQDIHRGYAAETIDISSGLEKGTAPQPIAKVFVDTRCLVFADWGLLADGHSVAEYADLRRRGEDKRARDILREKGAAIRYGFNRYGDELGVFEVKFEGENSVALWPDVIEETEYSES